MATQARPSQMGWQPKVESKGARLGGGGLATLAMPVVGAGGEGSVQHHGEGGEAIVGVERYRGSPCDTLHSGSEST
jgi:hypothetical protein